MKGNTCPNQRASWRDGKHRKVKSAHTPPLLLQLSALCHNFRGIALDLNFCFHILAVLELTSRLLPFRRYLVDTHWFKQWKKYVGFDSWDKYQMGDQNVYPGSVDNSGLLRGKLEY